MKITKVKSTTNKEKEYVVREMPNGEYRCSCPAFVFNDKKPCKHIKTLSFDDMELFDCPNGCGLLHQNFQNVGFEPPEGLPHYQVEDYYCPVCKFRIDDPEELEDEND